MFMCVYIASICKLVRTVLPTCCKKCLWSSANYQLQHTYTERHTEVQSTLHDRGRFGCMQAHITNIISVYVCAQGKHKTKHKRKTNNNNNMRKNQLTSSSLLCCCCWPCQQVGARTFGFGKVINFQLSLFVCLLFLALQESHKV